MPFERLQELSQDFAAGIHTADFRRPQAVNARSKQPFQPGIGPHSEAQTVELVAKEMVTIRPTAYADRLTLSVPYPEAPKQRCDLCIGESPKWEWAVEIKMLRILGDNGKVNDNILMHILSPYSAHRSAITDCDKLVESTLASRKGILIYAYEATNWPFAPVIDAFEALARTRVNLGPRCEAMFSGLVHPVHASGVVFAWELTPR